MTTETPFAEGLGHLRTHYSLGKAFYFRFTQASEFIKPHFFSAVGALDLRGVVLRIDKTHLHPTLRRQGVDLLSFFAAETIALMPATAGEDRKLIFDGLRAERSLM